LFDLIVIDALPVASSPESLTIAGQVDGVVLILEAEHTSIRLAVQTRDSIERSGGRLLGMVFNKRRQHVPGFIDQRLG
jgi:Mrp family chromosome partitioning ATPase